MKRSQLGTLDVAKSMHITAADYDLSLKLTDMRALMPAMDSCEKDLLAHWGMEPAVIASIKTKPTYKGNILGIFTTNDYPAAAYLKDQQGTAGVRFWIGIDGRASDCRVAESSGSKPLDEKTCEIIVRRARFEPARTEKGDRVATIAFQRIRWELPY